VQVKFFQKKALLPEEKSGSKERECGGAFWLERE
jgi:hypothetical protein